MAEPATEAAEPLAEGRYRLLQVLGAGGMAMVYRGYDSRLQVARAIKILAPALAQRTKVRMRFEAEARTMALLEHRNIVRVYDVGADGDRVYIIMEVVEGGSLLDRVEKLGPLPPKMALEVTIAMLKALQIAHGRGVIHRDIKPHNVLVTSDGEIRVTDFGIARVGDTADDNLTKTGAVMGTWAFMPPEQRVNAKGVDATADIYSTGATLFSLVTGETPADLFAADLDASMLADIAEPVAAIIKGATRYKREERYQSAAEMIAAAEEACKELPDTPADTPPLALPSQAPELPRRSGSSFLTPSTPPANETLAPSAGGVEFVTPAPTMAPFRSAAATMAPDMFGGELASDGTLAPPITGSSETGGPTSTSLGSGSAPTIAPSDLAEALDQAPSPSGRPGSARPATILPYDDTDERPRSSGGGMAKLALAAMAIMALVVVAAGIGGIAVYLVGQNRGTEQVATKPPASGNSADGETETTQDAARPDGTTTDEGSTEAEEEGDEQTAETSHIKDAAQRLVQQKTSTRTETSSSKGAEEAEGSSAQEEEAEEAEPAGAQGETESSDATPTLKHTPPGATSVGAQLTFQATINGPAYDQVAVYHRPKGTTRYQKLTMFRDTTTYSAHMKVDASYSTGLEYFIQARSTQGHPALKSGSNFSPHAIAVQ